MTEDDTRTYASLDTAIEPAIRPWRDSPRPLTLLFSGGVDSGLLAWELRSNPRLELLTIGSAGSADPIAARESAARLGLRVRVVELDPFEIAETSHRWAAALEGLSPVQRSVLVAFAVALGHAPTGPVLCGQGADELFLGYAHFQALGPEEATIRSDSDLRRLREEDGPRLDRVATALGRQVVAPYLDPGFVAAARGIPIRVRMPHGQPKRMFRQWAVHRGLPREIADRPKRAMQYGTGVGRLLARAESRIVPTAAVR
jgi:asparagine synthase (glutamine-hydrolysing)